MSDENKGIGEYWIRQNGKCVKIDDMNVYHSHNALKQIIRLASQGEMEKLFSHVGSEVEYSNQEGAA